MPDFPYVYYMLACSICGRKTLVEMRINGSNHVLTIVVNCAACLPNPSPEAFVKQQPEAAAKIQEWLNA